MNNNATPIEMLFEKAEEYGKTSLEIIKLQAIRKSADMISSLVSKAVITICIALFLFIFNIGLAIWIGKIIGEIYYGFFIISVFYILLAFMFYLFRNSWIKNPIKNNFIEKMLNENYDL